MSTKFTVMLCVHRPPAVLPFAMRTVLGQRHANLELFVVGDGAPAETIECAKTFAARDARVRVFDFPKGERLGEAHRHVALTEASGEFVAHIADDDLWFPDHLNELAALLEQVEFGNLILTAVRADGSFGFHPGDLADPGTRERMLKERWNFFGPIVAGYRLAAYRRLPVGWSPAPPDVWADLHMWRKFLRLEGISVATRFAITSIALPAVNRPHVPMQDRTAENERWFKIVSDPQGRSALRVQIQQALAKNYAATAQQLLARETELREQYQGTAKLNTQLSERAELIVGLTDRVNEKDAELARLADRAGEQLRARDGEIQELYWRIAELKAHLAARAGLIESLSAQVNEKDAELARQAAAAECIFSRAGRKLRSFIGASRS